MNLDAVRFGEKDLVPAIVQDARTHEVLTVAYINEESLRRTIETGETWFWSRSRNTLWHKGETSGNTQRVVSISVDCDGDALVVQVLPNGPACHKGERSCFHQTIHSSDSAVAKPEASLGTTLDDLYSVIEARRREMPEGSYTKYLFEQGLDKILKKLGEEASETIIAAKNDDRDSLVRESCDLVYHLLVLFAERGVSLAEVRDELARRRSVNPVAR
ncbi:MAG: bifunctional phosphoribosyl-AMP cyclohydrolase/phosphoribosyl-ATP diphosphatase HisIE [Verrucomicrobiota bacterium]|nr:bifunctional phosphoribosyl-AMP cyclohydrolase/phosphoribosyl-ATP diphosphatase HisIE [Verrucomicrobiota bacterium]